MPYTAFDLSREQSVDLAKDTNWLSCDRWASMLNLSLLPVPMISSLIRGFASLVPGDRRLQNERSRENAGWCAHASM